MARSKKNGSPNMANGIPKFHINFLNDAQKLAYGVYQQHDIVLMTGPAGTGKTHLASAFAVADVLSKKKKKIVLTRPVVEAGENLGFLPGTLEEKINPYILPVFDCFKKLVGNGNTEQFEHFLERYVEVAPIAYMRGRTFDDAVCIFDEAQNGTHAQLKLFLTRFGQNSKIVVTGDPRQTDLSGEIVPLVDIMHRIETLPGVGIVKFSKDSIVRHPLVSQILERLEA
jgi:phosphate starvation-inducible PhoH-like protein